MTTRTATGQTAQAAGTASWYKRTFPGRADQLSQVRREIAGYLAGCPAAADLVLIANELAANAIVHSRSRGEFFTVRCQAHPAGRPDRGRGHRRPLAAPPPQ